MKKRSLLAALMVSSMILASAGMAFASGGAKGYDASGKTVSVSQAPYASEGHWGHGGGHRGGYGGHGGCGY